MALVIIAAIIGYLCAYRARSCAHWIKFLLGIVGCLSSLIAMGFLSVLAEQTSFPDSITYSSLKYSFSTFGTTFVIGLILLKRRKQTLASSHHDFAVPEQDFRERLATYGSLEVNALATFRKTAQILQDSFETERKKLENENQRLRKRSSNLFVTAFLFVIIAVTIFINFHGVV